jgi:predicted secreted Zn-dependent protease
VARRRTGSLLACLTLFALLGAACKTGAGAAPTGPDAPANPTPAEQRVQLKTAQSTVYYAVKGSTTNAIFDFIEHFGPTDGEGQRGSGLTSAKWSYVWKGNTSRSGCSIGSMTISLDLVVTLPRHEQPSALPAAIATNWDKFAKEVTTHEQRHVDIYLDGAKTMQERMAAIPVRSSCSDLEKDLTSTWSGEQKEIEDAQGQFHAEEEAKIAAARAPIKAQMDANRARLAILDRQIQDSAAKVQRLRDETKSLEGQIEPLKTELDRIETTYGANLPPQVFARYESLRPVYNALAQRYNQVVDQHNAAIDEQTRLSAEHERLIAATNALVDTFNWTR